MTFQPIFHMGKPLVDPSFHAMEACKSERLVFHLKGKHREKGSFQDGNSMGISCKLVVSLEGNSFFSTSDLFEEDELNICFYES